MAAQIRNEGGGRRSQNARGKSTPAPTVVLRKNSSPAQVAAWRQQQLARLNAEHPELAVEALRRAALAPGASDDGGYPQFRAHGYECFRIDVRDGAGLALLDAVPVIAHGVELGAGIRTLAARLTGDAGRSLGLVGAIFAEPPAEKEPSAIASASA